MARHCGSFNDRASRRLPLLPEKKVADVREVLQPKVCRLWNLDDTNIDDGQFF